MMHENSLAAHEEEEATLGQRAMAIHDWLLRHGPATDRAVRQGMSFLDMNCVRPRITELIASGYAVEVGQIPCTVTGKRVRVVKAVPAAQRRPANQPPGQLELI